MLEALILGCKASIKIERDHMILIKAQILILHEIQLLEHHQGGDYQCP